MTRITLYTKPGCHLCESVEQVIAQVASRRALEIEIRNIEADPSDFARYQFDIPVVCVNGRQVARHRLTTRELEAVLDG